MPTDSKPKTSAENIFHVLLMIFNGSESNKRNKMNKIIKKYSKCGSNRTKYLFKTYSSTGSE